MTTSHIPLIIDGVCREASDGRRGEDRNPADLRHVVATYAVGTRDDARAAIDAASRAFPAWRATPAPQRGKVILKAMQLMFERQEEIAHALTMEEGKSLSDARGEVMKSIAILEFMSGEGRRLSGDQMPSELPNTLAYTRREPLGVISVITPWNFPVAIPTWKIAPALICGNTVVFKPATSTPWTGMLVATCFLDAGLPQGVLNFVPGGGSSVGDELVRNAEVRAITFTGSTAIGMALARDAMNLQKKCQCEMGGKNPIVVLEDADLELAALATVQGAFFSSGQRCTATSRAIVHKDVIAAYAARVVEIARGLKFGHGTDEGCEMGPLVDEGQLQSVLEYVEIGKADGARLLCGGGRPAGEHFAHGCFVEPTVFGDVQPHMRIAQEEIFGPVLSILEARDLDHAIELANGVAFGLSSSIYTRDLNRALTFIDRIETGITHVNSPTMGGEAHLPFGGMKATGIGPREQGKTAIDFYSDWKTVYIDYSAAARNTRLY